MTQRKLDGLGWLFAVLAAGMLANGVWMLVSPLRWYHDLPADVPDFGDFNPHFVRDIGCAFVTVGLALGWAAWSRRHRLPLAAVSAVFLVAHAILHVYDTARGAVDAHHWWLDLPSIYAPAIAVAVVTVHLARREGGADASRAH